MKAQLTLKPFPWDWSSVADRPHMAKLRDKLHEMFGAWQPNRLTKDPESYDYPKHELTVPADDLNFEKLLKKLDGEIRRAKPKVAGSVETFLSPEEVERARFLELFFYGDRVDCDANYRPLNPRAAVLCEVCQFPDITRVPQPLLLGNGALKKHEIFGTNMGAMVVRPRVKELLEKAIGRQIEVGEAVLAKPPPRGSGDHQFFWVRPREMIGDELLKQFPQKCRKCRRPRECRVRDMEDLAKGGGPKLYDLRKRVEHFGSGKSDLAVMGGYYGEIHDDGRPQLHWTMAISGALFTYLKANGLKGLSVGVGSGVKCFVSARDEPFLEPQARIFGPAAQSSKRAQKKVTKAAGSRKMPPLPRDCDDKGYVYFYLTSPELMVVDPMTWEEDSGGPCRIENFDGPGFYRLPVSAIKNAEETGVAVDSATLLLIDNEFFPALQEAYEWAKAVKPSGRNDWKYHDEIAAQIGNRFGICTTPSKRFKSDFRGDGFYQVDTKNIKRVKR
jgi:hypothetical protein